MNEIMIYMAGVIALAIAFAVRTPYQDLRTVVILSLLWPLSLVVMVFYTMLSVIKWDMDIVKVDKWFGFRKPSNSKATGFAVTIFKNEIQIFKARG